MNNIDEMPPKCHDCPYWEACDYPYICPDTEPKPAENGNINAEIAENLQNRPADVFIWKQDALAAVSKHIGIKGNKAYIVDVVNAYAEIEMLPPAQLDFFITEKIDKAYDDGYKAGYLQGEFDARNEALPPVQPKRGKWVKISPANIYECSKCGKHVMTNDISAYDFCHGCGADMRGGDNGKT